MAIYPAFEQNSKRQIVTQRTQRYSQRTAEIVKKENRHNLHLLLLSFFIKNNSAFSAKNSAVLCATDQTIQLYIVSFLARQLLRLKLSGAEPVEAYHLPPFL